MTETEFCPCCTSFRALQSTYKTYPQRWYERFWGRAAVGFFVGYGLLLLQTWLGVQSNNWLSLVGAVCYLVGWGLDVYVTHRLMQLKTEFDKRGVEFPAEEQHILIRTPHPTLKDMLWSRAVLADLILLSLSFVVPVLGVAALVMRICVVFANLRYRARLWLALRIVDGVIAGETAHVDKSGLSEFCYSVGVV